MNSFGNGLATGLVLQVAVGPVFFFIVNLALQKTILDGLAGTVAVTVVDYFYIALSILGIGKLLEHRRIKKVFGIVSSIVLIVFGMIIIRGSANAGVSAQIDAASANLLSSFCAVFFLTISSPMTIVFFTSLFTAKAVEYNYTKNELVVFGLGTGLATLLFMGTSVIVVSAIKGAVPALLIQTLNLIVGCLLVGYGGVRCAKVVKIRE